MFSLGQKDDASQVVLTNREEEGFDGVVNREIQKMEMDGGGLVGMVNFYKVFIDAVKIDVYTNDGLFL